ncbi:MAG: sulfate transporter substrate-binding protein [Alphaproteobacteria bacterium]|jgi:sulfate transport system substrate-binding protein|nr:sulfate transporter substrate-binding protein [Alphaproteobacteria bacterium]
MHRRQFLATLAGSAALIAAPFGVANAQQAPGEILNVSYDIARELFAAINPVFEDYWKKKGNAAVSVKQSHAGTSRQARAILEGLQADVVTFNQVPDIDVLAKSGLLPADWQKKFPNNASPYYSLPAFLVRKGNPKNVKDWPDLARDDVKLVFPNPKTSGNARYTYLAGYADALAKNGNDQEKAKAYAKKMLGNVAVFDTGGRGSTTTFVERQIGDVLITFEAEVFSIRREYGEDKFDVVIPPASLLAEFPVAVVEKVATRRGSTKIAQAYLEFLYSEDAQEIVAKSFHRVNNEKVKAKYASQFPNVKLYTVEQVFGGWDKATRDHFAEGAILDQVFVKR